MFRRCAFAFGLLVAVGLPSGRAGDPEKKVQEWRVLLIVKSKSDLALKGQPAVKAQLSDANVKAVRKAFEEHTPYWVERVSEGRLRWKTEVVVSDAAVTSASPVGSDTFWLAPWDVQDDIRKYAPAGKYDGVFIYWKATDEDGKGPKVGFGWSVGPGENSNHAGYTSVHFGATDLWDRDSETTEVFLHEWQHQLEAFYGPKGVKLPKNGLHGGPDHGYKYDPRQFWKPWYTDFLAGRVRESDKSLTGLGEAAWSQGTIRAAAAVFTSEFLTPDRKKKNLLKDPSFEAPESGAWRLDSWKENKEAGRIVVDEKAREGRRVAVLDTPKADDVRFVQTVAVKPKTKYLFSGWVKMEGVKNEVDRKPGANLAVMGRFDRTRPTLPTTGTHDWTYYAFVFDSGDRKSVDVAGRLGHHDGTASGKVWFDDLCLVELP